MNQREDETEREHRPAKQDDRGGQVPVHGRTKPDGTLMLHERERRHDEIERGESARDRHGASFLANAREERDHRESEEGVDESELDDLPDAEEIDRSPSGPTPEGRDHTREPCEADGKRRDREEVWRFGDHALVSGR